MKKIFTLLTILFASIVLVSCGSKTSEVAFSKVMTDPYFSESAIELYNFSDKEINLKNHFIDIYPSSTREVETTIALKGKIPAKGYFYIVKDDTFTEALDLADQLYEGRYLTGSETIVLRKGKAVSDIIGNIGSSYIYINPSMGSTYVRKPDRIGNRQEFVINDYIEFGANRYDMLGSLETGLTDEDFEYGPRLTNVDRERPFKGELVSGDIYLGGGGTVKVSVTRLNDGDTTSFNFKQPNLIHDRSGNDISSNASTRYYYVDTPETQADRQEEFGYPASNFTNDILTEAERLGLDIEVMTPKGLSMDGSFDRYFGQVFVDGYSLSYLLIRLGLSDNGADPSGQESDSNYKGLTWESWMRQAGMYAQENKIGVNGDHDPSHYYEGKDLSENIGYRPFFLKPYSRGDSVAVVTTEVELNAAIANSKVKTIDIANDIKLENTIDVIGVSNKHFIGFLHTLSIDKTKVLFNIDNSTNIVFDNIKLTDSLNPIVAKNSSVTLVGVIDISGNEGAIKGLAALDLTLSMAGVNGTKNNLKLINETSGQASIVFEYAAADLDTTRRLFKGISLVKSTEGTKVIYKLG